MPPDDAHDAAKRELARLKALADYRILDTEAERSFDEIARLASIVCQTPVSLVSFVETDRQWFKARVGFEACQTPISQSVCRHALHQTDLLIIPDLTRDPRTWDNTLVTEHPAIRFYAGAPLVTPEGVVVGTLCVIDTEPRPHGLTVDQAMALETLGRQVVAQLELRKALSHSAEQAGVHKSISDRSRFAEEAGGIGTFELDVATGMMVVSPQYCRLFGLPMGETLHASASERLVLPEDAEMRSSDVTRQNASADADVEYRVRRADDGEVRWLARRARFHRDETGQPIRMYGTVHDVTDRHRRQFQQERLLRLGDDLREAGRTRDVAALAGKALGEVLRVDRSGYARIDHASGRLVVEADWASDGLPSIVGAHSLAPLQVTLEKLATGDTLALANIPATHWLGSDLAQYEAAKTVAMIDIPLLDHGQLVGIVFAHQSVGRTWRRDEVDFAHSVADLTHAAMARIDAEANQRVLNMELGHRMKNQLALVQAIVGQTLRSASDLKSAGDVLSARIQVLATAHDMVIAGTTGRTTVSEIVRNVVLLHDNQLETRFVVEGPNIQIASRPALSLALILHELSTNAAKYGALSAESGNVKIKWEINRNEGEPLFVFSWSEHGGPPVSQPERKGSGSRLIRAGLSGTAISRVSVDFEQDGLRCEIVADLHSLQTER